VPVGIPSMNRSSQGRDFCGTDSGSAVIEFVLIFPVALALILITFSDAHSLQMRQLGVTLIARELGRGIEIGLSPREIGEALLVLRDDLGFMDDPGLVFEKTDEDHAILTVKYKGETYSTRLSTKHSSPLWRQLQWERGSGLPLFIALIALLLGVSALFMNMSAGRIADVRANDLASSLAISSVESAVEVGAETSGQSPMDWSDEIRSRISFRVESPDNKTTEVRLCYEYRPIWLWLASDTQQACAERRVRLVTP